MADMAKYPWHDPEWGRRFCTMLEVRGMSGREFGRRAGIDKSEVTRMKKGLGTLPSVIKACHELRVAPPRALCNDIQGDILAQIEELSAIFHASLGGDADAVDAALKAWVAEVAGVTRRYRKLHSESE